MGRDPIAFLKPEDNGGLEEVTEEVVEAEEDPVEEVYIPMKKTRNNFQFHA